MLILIPILLALWTLGWTLRPRLSALPSHEAASISADSISIIIPARNEAHNLPRLLDSITSQPNPPAEILVVDDGSTDGTADVAAAHGAIVIPSKPLPDGWRGKPWACHQGAQAASSSHLLFLDADTWFEPGGLDAALAHYHGGALSIGPWHVVQQAYESLSMFFNMAMTAGTVPDGLFGQMLLIDRDSYHTAGGHHAVRSHILENVHLQQLLLKNNTATRSLPGRGIVHFRMYPGGPREMIGGWSKGFASGAGRTAKATLVTLILWMIGLMGAFIGLAIARDPLWAILYLIFATQVAILSRKVGSFPWFASLLYPLPLIFFFAIFTRSACGGGSNTRWKGRSLHAL